MGIITITIQVLKLTCERCGYSWISYKKMDKLPVFCPKCLSRGWNSLIRFPKISEARRKILKEKREKEDKIKV